MAKKKSQSASPSMGGGSGRVTTSIDSAENGFIVHTSSEGSGPGSSYVSKTFVAPTHDAALRIASAHIECCGSKAKGKKGKGKKGKSKIATSKR
jgi:hypothetical protein